MTQYIDKSAVVAEIERRVTEGEKVAKEVPSSAIMGLIQAYKNTLSFLDTLEVKEESVSEDLEEAATKYAQDKYLPVQTAQSFKAGAQWQKEQTIDKACEWLEEHLLDFWSQKITNTDYFIEDFKQVMNK